MWCGWQFCPVTALPCTELLNLTRSYLFLFYIHIHWRHSPSLKYKPEKGVHPRGVVAHHVISVIVGWNAMQQQPWQWRRLLIICIVPGCAWLSPAAELSRVLLLLGTCREC